MIRMAIGEIKKLASYSEKRSWILLKLQHPKNVLNQEIIANEFFFFILINFNKNEISNLKQ